MRLSSRLAGHVDKLKAVELHSNEGVFENVSNCSHDEVKGEAEGFILQKGMMMTLLIRWLMQLLLS